MAAIQFEVQRARERGRAEKMIANICRVVVDDGTTSIYVVRCLSCKLFPLSGCPTVFP